MNLVKKSVSGKERLKEKMVGKKQTLALWLVGTLSNPSQIKTS
jgi:hypothetical protein